MPTTQMPPLPKRLLFSGTGIKARATGCTFSEPNQNGNISIAVGFKIAAGQRAEMFSAPDPAYVAKTDSFKHLAGAVPGNIIEIPEGVQLSYIKVWNKSTEKVVVPALQNAGWRGTTPMALWRASKGLPGASYEGLGEIDCLLTVSINAVDNRDDTWVMRDARDGEQGDASGKVFNPTMRVEWVNAVAGAFQFRDQATEGHMLALEAQLGKISSGGGAGTAGGTGVSSPGAAGGEDDIPF